MAELTHNQKQQILKEVILKDQHPEGESPEAAAWRAECVQDVRKITDQGMTPEIPWDASDPD